MTNSYEFAVIALVSVVTCKLVSNILYGHSFFDRQLLDRGIDIFLGRTHLKLGIKYNEIYNLLDIYLWINLLK